MFSFWLNEESFPLLSTAADIGQTALYEKVVRRSDTAPSAMNIKHCTFTANNSAGEGWRFVRVLLPDLILDNEPASW